MQGERMLSEGEMYCCLPLQGISTDTDSRDVVWWHARVIAELGLQHLPVIVERLGSTGGGLPTLFGVVTDRSIDVAGGEHRVGVGCRHVSECEEV